VAEPVTQYARSGDAAIAYQLVGGGELDLVYIPSATHHVELAWENPPHERFFRRLASLARLIIFDKRGTGMSDRIVGTPTLEARMEDIRAVLDAAESERAVLFANGDAGPLCTVFAATYPERTAALVLMNSSPRIARSPEFPWLPKRADLERRYEDVERQWGERSRAEVTLREQNPSATQEEVRALTRMFRLSVSPGAAAAYFRMNLDVDVSHVLPLIHVPTLVLHRRELRAPDVRSGLYLAGRILGARFVELPGADMGPPYGDQELLFSHLETFFGDIIAGNVGQPEPDRVLATVLFTDLVESTAHAVELGPRWKELLRHHNAAVRRELSHYRGAEIDTAGDGFFASGFDGPARAIRCACAIRDAVATLDLRIRIGVHTGECDIVDGKLSGLAVNIGARVAAQATEEKCSSQEQSATSSPAPASSSNQGACAS
jgi:pimeloyl-ACP methyl ester carboxylesterase